VEIDNLSIADQGVRDLLSTWSRPAVDL